MQNQNKFVGNSQSLSPPPTFSTEFSPLYMCCNIHHFGITKRKVMASKLQVTASKLQVTTSKLQVTASKLQVTASKLQVTLTKLQLRPQNYKLRVQNLQVWQLKLISYNFLKRCFECTVNGSLQMVVFYRRRSIVSFLKLSLQWNQEDIGHSFVS